MPRGQTPSAANLAADAQTLVASLTALGPTVSAVSVNAGQAVSDALVVAQRVAADGMALASEAAVETTALQQQVDSLKGQVATLQAQLIKPVITTTPPPPGGSTAVVASGMTPGESGALGTAIGLVLGSVATLALTRRKR
jgi:hypothetical protein